MNFVIPNLLGDSHDIQKFEPSNPINLNIPPPNPLEKVYDKRELDCIKSGATDAIKLAITPEWAEVNTNEDNERIGRVSVKIISFDKKYNKKMDGDLEGFVKRIGKE